MTRLQRVLPELIGLTTRLRAWSTDVKFVMMILSQLATASSRETSDGLNIRVILLLDFRKTNDTVDIVFLYEALRQFWVCGSINTDNYSPA